MHDLHSLVARQLGRPVLMTPDAAETLATRIYNAEPRAFRSETKFAAFLRLAGRGRPQALDADDIEAEPLPRGGMAYVPLWMEDAGGPDDELGFGMSLKHGIACLNIDTAISARGSEFCGAWYHGYDTIAAALRQAFADDRVRGIFIRFETPGGVVDDGIDEVSEILRENREAAGGKPVWGFCDVAASAGYWIASQCDRLIASRTGIVGSIGAVMIHTEYSGMLAKDGIRVTPIQFGAQKTAGNMFQELSETA
ncbi:MAG: S49 family peptidase, partial [Hyphomonas sp.]|nr:S49 family peptidase [Hyphomonas sp.]